MWNSKKSVILSLIVCFIVSIVLVLTLFTMPQIVNMYFGSWRGFSAESVKLVTKTVLICYYPSAFLGLIALASLNKMLFNIKAEKPFINENVLFLRIISWCCFVVALMCAVASYIYYSMIFVSIASGFVGLILRVVKNVMQSAVQLQSENDLTI